MEFSQSPKVYCAQKAIGPGNNLEKVCLAPGARREILIKTERYIHLFITVTQVGTFKANASPFPFRLLSPMHCYSVNFLKLRIPLSSCPCANKFES